MAAAAASCLKKCSSIGDDPVLSKEYVVHVGRRVFPGIDGDRDRRLCVICNVSVSDGGGDFAIESILRRSRSRESRPRVACVDCATDYAARYQQRARATDSEAIVVSLTEAWAEYKARPSATTNAKMTAIPAAVAEGSERRVGAPRKTEEASVVGKSLGPGGAARRRVRVASPSLGVPSAAAAAAVDGGGGGSGSALNRSLISHPPSAPPPGIARQSLREKTTSVKEAPRQQQQQQQQRIQPPRRRFAEDGDADAGEVFAASAIGAGGRDGGGSGGSGGEQRQNLSEGTATNAAIGVEKHREATPKPTEGVRASSPLPLTVPTSGGDELGGAAGVGDTLRSTHQRREQVPRADATTTTAAATTAATMAASRQQQAAAAAAAAASHEASMRRFESTLKCEGLLDDVAPTAARQGYHHPHPHHRVSAPGTGVGVGDMPLTPPPLAEHAYDRRFYGQQQQQRQDRGFQGGSGEQYHREGRSAETTLSSSLGLLSPIYPTSTGGAGAGVGAGERGSSGTGCAMNGNMSSEDYSAMRSGGGGDNHHHHMPRHHQLQQRSSSGAGGGAGGRGPVPPPPMARPSALLPQHGGGHGHGHGAGGHGGRIHLGEGDLGGVEGYPFDDQSNLGFLVVTQLVKTGAADQAGLHVGDIFIKFGSITKSNFPGLKSLAEIVRQSVSINGIPAVVLRRMEACVNDNGQPLVFDSPVLQKIHLTLRPLQSQDVCGGGVLGAVINTWPLPEPVKYH